MEQITLKVEGMSCGHCVKAVESSVGELAGIKAVKVDLENGLVDIAFNEKEVSVEAIKETIDDQGYDIK
ncbi:copper chaperone CopZ [Niallia nealsonii]|uniref:Copper chaperone CopZ n=1 Tax=Niallia nealsonii TaxID=115979 RepID=A0A2N0Z213_9BACI|nr:copper chaperone CopZ [Niallia nealsonii]PKG23542.1 copper resistance protein CopZ [Niallia nealsonii]